jgi:hypothetical protein
VKWYGLVLPSIKIANESPPTIAVACNSWIPNATDKNGEKITLINSSSVLAKVDGALQ